MQRFEQKFGGQSYGMSSMLMPSRLLVGWVELQSRGVRRRREEGNQRQKRKKLQTRRDPSILDYLAPRLAPKVGAPVWRQLPLR